MSDGSRLRDSWTSALKHAQAHFRSLLNASSSSLWKHVPVSQSRDNTAASTSAGGSTQAKGKTGILPNTSDVVVHRRTGKGGEVLRLVLDVPAEDGLESLDAWKAVLTTPEMRKEWDPTVENAHIIEMFDTETRIAKTDFTLGWPVNPRDAITISRSFTDATTLIDISTSLPRSPDEPAYLRPAPPYVRSHVHLFAWCVQLAPTASDGNAKQATGGQRLRITCFWQHDLKAVWGASTLSQNLPAVVIGLVHAVKKRGARIPLLTGWGRGVGLDNIVFAAGREALRLDYSVIHEIDDSESMQQLSQDGANDLRRLKERKRLERSIEVIVPITHGWEIHITTRASSEETAKLPWTVHATKITPSLLASSAQESEPSSSRRPSLAVPPSPPIELVALRIVHARPMEHAVLKVKVNIELAGATKGLRVNGTPHPIEDSESRDPSGFTMSKQMLQEAASVSDLSFQTSSTSGSNQSGASAVSKKQSQSFVQTGSDRTPGAEKAILTLVRRNYIYFTSLLQEPEAKWRPVTESRGVTITQLDSIDPTLVVYRAEAVFVGVGLWDLLSTVKTPGTRFYWDKSYDDAVLLEDTNELTELWHHTTKAAWPVNARDTVVLTTEYKSPTSAHLFSFSTDDYHLFPSIPQIDPATIRTQVDLRGWAIEALSPNTTLLTLLDQSDPKGWSNKSSIPQQMIATVAGVGEFAIKYGGPPVATRLGGAKFLSMKYDHEKGSYKVAYEGSEARRGKYVGSLDLFSSTPGGSPVDLPPTPTLSERPPFRSSNTVTSTTPASTMPKIECQLRCDIETWSSSLALVIDPPPQSVSCLKRHRLANGGGGLWITIEHDATFVGDERLRVSVRRGTPASAKEKGVVLVNGSKVKVDVEDLPESEVKTLAKQKRIKPVRIPLDRPPVLGVIRRRREEWDEEAEATNGGTSGSSDAGTSSPGSTPPTVPTSTLSFSNPWGNFFTSAVTQTINTTNAAAAVLNPVGYIKPATPTPVLPAPPSGEPKLPMARALDALSYLSSYRRNPTSDGWLTASEKGLLPVYKKVVQELSPSIPIHRAEKVIEGVSAGEISWAITNLDNRKAWDDRFASYTPLEEYGNGCSTAFVSTKSGFPFRDRGFWVASVVARLIPQSANSRGRGADESQAAAEPAPHTSSILIVSSSFDPTASKSQFSLSKVNPTVLPTGQLVMSGWILETVDPYVPDQNYAIPSTRCTHFVAIDYRGSVPVAFNTSMNAMLPRTEILALEAWLKAKGGFVVGPGVRYPPSGLVLEDEPKDVSSGNVARLQETEDGWALVGSDDDRFLVSTKLDASTKVFSCRILMNPTPRSAVVDEISDSPSSSSSQPTPQPSRFSSFTSFANPSRPSTPGASTDQGSMHTSTSTIKDRTYSATLPRMRAAQHRRVTSFSPGRNSSSSPSRPGDRRSMSFSSAITEDESDRPPEDMIVAELVVDPTLFPDGYKVDTLSARPTKTAKSGGNGTILANAPLGIAPVPLKMSLLPSESTQLPLSAAIYTIPASPLLSTNSDTPVARHLLRFSLPTAQYHVPPILDPLTGEIRRPPAQPSWLTDLNANGSLIDITLTPTSAKPKGVSIALTAKVVVDGKDVPIVNEKSSVSAIGREVLEDDKLGCYPVLRRIHMEEGSLLLPIKLTEPLAVDQDLLEAPQPLLNVLGPSPGLMLLTDEPQPMVAEDLATNDTTPSATTALESSTSPSVNGNGIFSFWNVSTTLLGISRRPSPQPPQETTEPTNLEATVKVEDISETTAVVDDTPKPPLPAPQPALATSRALDRTFPLSTLLIVAIISFLCGSLLRSLLSPADFIYFTPSTTDDGSGAVASHDPTAGWREVKRLVELKHGLIGWDFVVAVVRRRPPEAV